MKYNATGNHIRERTRNGFAPLTAVWAVALLVVSLFAFACERDRGEMGPKGGVGGPAEGEMGVTIKDVVDNPDRYLGKTVTVSGEVEDIHGPKAFTLGGEGFLFNKELLVVSARPVPEIPDRPGDVDLVKDDITQVTGTVRRMTVAEVEREIGWDLHPDLEAEFIDKPVLIARSIHVTPRGEVARRG